MGSSKGRAALKGTVNQGLRVTGSKGDTLLIRGMSHNTLKTQARQVSSSGHQARLSSSRKAKPIGLDQQGYIGRCRCGCNIVQARTKHKKHSLNESPKR